MCDVDLALEVQTDTARATDHLIGSVVSELRQFNAADRYLRGGGETAIGVSPADVHTMAPDWLIRQTRCPHVPGAR